MDIEKLKVLAGLQKRKEVGIPYNGISSYTPPVVRQYNVNNTGDNPMMEKTTDAEITELFKKYNVNGEPKIEVITKVANAIGVKADDIAHLFDDVKPSKTLKEYFEDIQSKKI